MVDHPVITTDGRLTDRRPLLRATNDLNVIKRAILVAQQDSARSIGSADHSVMSDPPAPPSTNPSVTTPSVYVTPNGELIASEPGADQGARLSTVVGDTFYVDLNVIQRAVLEQQRNGGQAADKDSVYVDNNGEVMLGSDVGDPSRASSVVGDTFYARDLAIEARTAQYKMPSAVKVSDGTYEGYAYSIHNDFGDTYELFIYYDSAYRVYRVALVSPRMGGEWDPHGGHLWSDGTLCLTHNAGSGYPSMEQTYAKSVLWTYGASLYRRGYGFQFNVGQEGDSRA